MKRVIAICSLLAAPAFANDHAIVGETLNDYEAAVDAEAGFILDNLLDEGSIPHGKNHPCARLNLTEAQKSSIQTAVFDMKRSKIAAKAALETAELDYKQLVMQNGEGFAAAAVVDLRLAKGVSDMVAAGTTLRTNILFKIVEADQRKATAMCMAMIRKHKKMKKIAEMCRGMHHGPHHPKHPKNPKNPGKPSKPNPNP